MNNKSPLDIFIEFIEKERNAEKKLLNLMMEQDIDHNNYRSHHFIGHIGELEFKKANVFTHNNLLAINNGCPKHSYLIAIAKSLVEKTQSKNPVNPHFILMEVNEIGNTPMTSNNIKTFFDVVKTDSTTEMDPYTTNELCWSSLECNILGVFSKDHEDGKNIFKYSTDIKYLQSPIFYKVYRPCENIINIIINNEFENKNDDVLFDIGDYRPTENESKIYENQTLEVPPKVKANINDIIGKRTALFGKTRLGKSNTVKLILKTIIEKTRNNDKIKVGQLIFDINGEYANDNEQDDGKSISSYYKENTSIYAIKPRGNNISINKMKYNFYLNPQKRMYFFKNNLIKDGQQSQNAVAFYSVDFESINEINKLIDKENKKISLTNKEKDSLDKYKIYLAILHEAGYDCGSINSNPFNWNIYTAENGINLKNKKYSQSNNIEDMVDSLLQVSDLFKYDREGLSRNPEILALVNFFNPTNNAGGVKILSKYKEYHEFTAINKSQEFEEKIIGELYHGKTVILDLGNTEDHLRQYFSDTLTKYVMNHQENKFTENNNSHYIQLYFEEAHNLFPRDAKTVRDVYSRIAKEGAKFKIGLVYSTQSPSTITQELLAQTENFFIGHISSQSEVQTLIKVQSSFLNHENAIIDIKKAGYMRIYTSSHRFVIPCQVDKFNKNIILNDSIKNLDEKNTNKGNVVSHRPKIIRRED